jgi:arsenate reductase (thioredoxin)
MTGKTSPYRVLFLCTGNSARSVFAEYFLRRLGEGRFEVHSAGANPSGIVNPLTLKVLRDRFHLDASEARSKSWEEFKGVNFDFVITVCDNARETCPVWPGQPIVAHWGVDDPAAFEGSAAAKERFFYHVAMRLYRRVQLLVSLPIEKLSRLKLEKLTREIGEDKNIGSSSDDRTEDESR